MKILIVEDDEKLHIYSGASCIGQGLGTVLVQMVVTNTDLKHQDIVYERSNTWIAPDSGTTSGSRQTLITGEACRRACEKLMEDRKTGKSLSDMKGNVYYGEYLAKKLIPRSTLDVRQIHLEPMYRIRFHM